MVFPVVEAGFLTPVLSENSIIFSFNYIEFV